MYQPITFSAKSAIHGTMNCMYSASSSWEFNLFEKKNKQENVNYTSQPLQYISNSSNQTPQKNKSTEEESNNNS